MVSLFKRMSTINDAIKERAARVTKEKNIQRAIPLFDFLPSSQRRNIMSYFQTETIYKGQFLFKEGDIGMNAAYVVITGECILTKKHAIQDQQLQEQVQKQASVALVQQPPFKEGFRGKTSPKKEHPLAKPQTVDKLQFLSGFQSQTSKTLLIAIKSYGQWIGEEAILAQTAKNARMPSPKKKKTMEEVEPLEPVKVENFEQYTFSAQALNDMTVYKITIQDMMKLENMIKEDLVIKAKQEKAKRKAMLEYHSTIQKDITDMGQLQNMPISVPKVKTEQPPPFTVLQQKKQQRTQQNIPPIKSQKPRRLNREFLHKEVSNGRYQISKMESQSSMNITDQGQYSKPDQFTDRTQSHLMQPQTSYYRTQQNFFSPKEPRRLQLTTLQVDSKEFQSVLSTERSNYTQFPQTTKFAVTGNFSESYKPFQTISTMSRKPASRLIRDPYDQFRKTQNFPQGSHNDLVQSNFISSRESLQRFSACFEHQCAIDKVPPGHQFDNSKLRSDFLYKMQKQTGGFFCKSNEFDGSVLKSMKNQTENTVTPKMFFTELQSSRQQHLEDPCSVRIN